MKSRYFDTIKELIADISSCDIADRDIHGDTNLEELGIDSLKFMKLIIKIEKAVGQRIFDSKNIADIRTLADIDRFVQEAV